MYFYFDKIQQLYKDNPEEFAALARHEIYNYIYTIPNEKRRDDLLELQEKIDRDLSHYKDPIARMNRMVELFWIQVRLLDEALNGVLQSPLVNNVPMPVESTAEIIKFPSKKD
mgnify:CR=1 FL=1